MGDGGLRAGLERGAAALAGLALVLASPLSGDGGGVAALRHGLLLLGLALVAAALVPGRRALAIAVVTAAYAGYLAVGPGNAHFGIWLLRGALFGQPEIGIFESDDRFGYAHVPGARGVHRGLDFVARYAIDDDGCRATPPASGDARTLLLLGGSYAFGHGVSDEENLAWRLGLALSPDVRVRNCAAMGWGTAQAYLWLEREIAAGRRPDAVVYTWHDHHLYRNHLRRKWLRALARHGRGQPHFEVEDGHLVFVGIADEASAIPGSAAQRERELDVTRALLRGMQALCAAHDVPLLVVRFSPEDGPGTEPDVLAALDELGIGHVDATRVPGSFHRHDRHPRADWHAAAAELIGEALRARGIPPPRR